MFGKIYWMLIIGGSVAAVVLSAAAKNLSPTMAYLHMGVSALFPIIFALLGIRDTRSLIERGGSRMAVAAAKSRSMAHVWTWGALCLFATYATGILAWKEWLHFTIPFFGVAALCIYFASALLKDDRAGKIDESLLTISGYLNKFQLAAMIVTMAGLLIDGKMTRFFKEAGQRAGGQDWAANNYFFFGALALAALSFHAISRNGQAKEPASRQTA